VVQTAVVESGVVNFPNRTSGARSAHFPDRTLYGPVALPAPGIGRITSELAVKRAESPGDPECQIHSHLGGTNFRLPRRR
jgi:hypothetical protein